MTWSLTSTARHGQGGVFALLGGGLAALALAGLALGPVALSPADLAAALTGRADPMAAAILTEIRAPRVALGMLVGVTLALAGATLQGLLRNPLADPGLIGVTAGASLGAVFVIVLGAGLEGGLPRALRPYLLPIGAFLGASVVTALVFGIARRAHGTSVATLILAGVAINAIAGAGIGVLIYVSDDQQLRDLTFWSMGSLGGASWVAVPLTAFLAGAACLALARFARPLDLFQIGERAARHAGLDTERVKLFAGILIALGVGTVTAAAGPIGFIGLVAPHMARLVVGPRHGLVLPAAALIGAGLVLAADLLVRLAVPPAEPPIGLATSLLGGPFFLWLLMSRMREAQRV